MRLLKIIVYSLGGLLAALLLAIVAIWLTVNPNDYKDRIIREVRASTGRELALPGAIKLSVFPWVALELGPASLGNPAGFQGNDFLSVEHAALRVRLLPLLRKNLQIGRIEIDRLNLHLQKNAAGKGNWEDFGEHRGAAGSGGASAANGSIFQSLAGITVSNSRVTYNTFSVADLDVDIGSVAQKASVPVKLRFNLDRGPDASTITLAADLQLSLDMPARQYGLAAVSVKGELKSKSAAPSVPFEFSTPAANLDLAAQTLLVPQFAAQFAAAKLAGSLKADQIVDHPVVTGSLSLEPVALRVLAAQLGTDLPTTRDPAAFARFSLKANFRYADKAAALESLEAQLDDSRLRGSMTVTDLDTKAATFALNLDSIDIDRYRPPLPTAPVIPSTGKPAQLPADALKSLDLHGSFAIGSAKYSGLTFSDVNLNLQARDGLIRLAPLKARMYGGQYSGDITYDVRGAAPQLQLNQQFVNIDMAPLLKDGFDSRRLSGHGNATTVLAGSGLDSDALMKSLSGRIDMNLAEGAIEGADLWYEISVAQALLKRQMPSGANTKHTKFDALKMSATVAAGVATTNDLIVATPYLRVNGQGTTNIVNKAIDLHLMATVLKAPPNSQGTDLAQLTLAQIPVNVTGTANDPKVRPDLQGLIRSQLQQKAKDLLQDKLKGFFGTH